MLYGKQITSISAGSYHSLVLTDEGKVYAWGINSGGQIGDGTTNESLPSCKTNPVCISDVHSSPLYGKEVIAISAGFAHSFAITKDGKVYAWGINNDGQLGNGTNNSSIMPICISDIQNSALFGKVVTSISAGTYQSIATTNDGKVYTWGWGGYNVLGDGTSSSKKLPVCISEITSSALYSKNIIKVSASQTTSMAVDSNGKLYTWGYNVDGRLFDGTTSDKPLPICVSNISTSPLFGKQVTKISSGTYHNIALTSEGKVYACGDNSSGAIGNASTSPVYVPVCISDISTEPLYGKTVTEINAGSFHNIALTNDGKLYSWGYNDCGQLGNESPQAQTSPKVSTFDKNVSEQNDITVTMMLLNGSSFSSISSEAPTLMKSANHSLYNTLANTNEVALTKDIDYTVSKNTVTIKKSYLANQPLGQKVLKLNFDGAAPQSLIVEMTNSSPASSVTDLTFDNKIITIIKGDSFTITPTFSPVDASNKGLIWSPPSDQSIISVDQSGNITGLEIGTATITATSVDGNMVATCLVEVVPNISVSTSYKINLPIITDGVNVLQTLPSTGNINVVYRIANTTTEDKNVNVIMSIYDDNKKLLYTKRTPVDITNNSGLFVMQHLEIPSSYSKCTLKIFTWDSNLVFCNPLSQVTSFR